MAKPRFLGITGGQGSFFWEKTWQSIATWWLSLVSLLNQVAELCFLRESDSQALLLRENRWPTLISQRKHVAERFLGRKDFLGKTGGQALFLGKNRRPSLVSQGKQVAEPGFLGKIGGPALFLRKTSRRALFLGEIRWPCLVSWEKQVAEPQFSGETDG